MAAPGPETIDFGEEAGDLPPACSFAGLARFADQYDEEIEAVTGGAHDAVGRGAGEVAEGGQELQEDGSGIGQCGRSNSLRWGSGRRLGIFRVIGFFGFLVKTGVFFKAGLFLIEGVVRRRGGWRRPLPGPGRPAAPCGGVVWRRGWAGKGKNRWCWLRVS